MDHKGHKGLKGKAKETMVGVRACVERSREPINTFFLCLSFVSFVSFVVKTPFQPS